MRRSSGFLDLAAALIVGVALVAAPSFAVASAPAPTASRFDPSAEAAYRAALELIRQGESSEAVERLDLAIELEPHWAAPVRLRAEAFGKLADRYRPSEAFLAAQAADLERLLTLEPGIESAARQQQIATLSLQSREAREAEQKRRDLAKPALIVITLSAVTVISGALMLSFYPSTPIEEYGQKRYVYTGAAMLAVGAALAVPAITLGVLAGRQAKRDSAVRDFNVRTARPQAKLGLVPQPVPAGGGLALRLRF